MTIDFQQQVKISPNVIFRELQGEGVLLDLASERYFGLDDIGTQIWNLLSTSTTINQVFEKLEQEYEVEPERLQQDLEDLLSKLIENGLISVSPVQATPSILNGQ